MSSVNMILFNGPPRSGKDTATMLAQEVLIERCGPHRVYRYRFAQPLKDATHAIFGMPGLLTEHFDSVKDVPLKEFFGMSPREAYIWMSEEVMKPKFGRDFFARVAVNHLKSFGGLFVVISDCGFQEEIEALVDYFGADHVHLVRLLRDGTGFESDSRRFVEHRKERTYTLLNNGTLSDLKSDMHGIVESIFRDSRDGTVNLNDRRGI